MAGSETIHIRMTGEELRASWQGRALAYVQERSLGQIGAALLSLLADSYDETMPFLLKAVFPDASGIRTPFYCSNAIINKRGNIVADMIDRFGQRRKNVIVFLSTEQMQTVYRRLADALKLSDDDRRDLFACVQNWVKADQRLDPTMDRRDPDARRLVLN